MSAASDSIIAYIGYGAFAKQIEQLLRDTKSPLANYPTVIFDDYAYRDGIKNSFQFSEYLNSQFKDCWFIVAVGYNHLQEKFNIVQQLKQMSRRCLSIIHPNSYIAPGAIVEDGCVIFPGCILEMNTVIHAGSVLYDGCIVAHDSSIGSCCFLAPRVTIAGRTQIGDRTFLGIGSTVINDIQCGKDCTIGAASLIQQALPDHTNGIGNPFHIAKNKTIKIH